MSPDSAGGFVRRAAPEPNKRALYVGGLDPRVTEDVLRQIFETTGHVQNVKIIPDKNVGAVSINFSMSNPARIVPPATPNSPQRDLATLSALLPQNLASEICSLKIFSILITV